SPARGSQGGCGTGWWPAGPMPRVRLRPARLAGALPRMRRVSRRTAAGSAAGVTDLAVVFLPGPSVVPTMQHSRWAMPTLRNLGSNEWAEICARDQENGTQRRQEAKDDERVCAALESWSGFRVAVRK